MCVFHDKLYRSKRILVYDHQTYSFLIKKLTYLSLIGICHNMHGFDDTSNFLEI